MKIDCDTCLGTECKGSLKWGCVILHKYIAWTPQNTINCLKCDYWHSEGKRCVRHSEPCVQNYFFYKNIKFKWRKKEKKGEKCE